MKNLMKKSLSLWLTLLLVGAAVYAQEALPQETITITLPGQAPVVLSLPAGSLAGMYAVRQAQGRQGTMVEIFQEDVQQWLAREATHAQRWLLVQAQRRGYVSSEAYGQYLQAVLQAQAEAAAAAAQAQAEVAPDEEAP